jgi:hypothetical protein
MAPQHPKMKDVLPESSLHFCRKQLEDEDELIQDFLQKQHDFAQLMLQNLKPLQGSRDGSPPLWEVSTQGSVVEAPSDVFREDVSVGNPGTMVEWLSLKDLGLFRGDADSLEDFLAQVRRCHEHWSDNSSRLIILRSLPLCMAGPAWPWYQRLSQSFKDEKLKDLAGWEYELRREFSDGVPAEVGPVPAEEHGQSRTLLGEARGIKPVV